MVDPKTITIPEWGHIYRLVTDLLETIKYDDTGVTDDLINETLVVAEILKILPEPPDEEEE